MTEEISDNTCDEIIRCAIDGIVGISSKGIVHSGYDCFHDEASASSEDNSYEVELMAKSERIKLGKVMVTRWAQYLERIEQDKDDGL